MGKNFNSSTKPPFAAQNVLYFTDESELPAPVAGVITPEPNSVWIMYNDDPNASQKQITISSEIALPDNGGFRLTSVGLATCLLIYVGSGTLFNTTDNYTGFAHIDELFLAAPAGTVFGMSGVLPVGQEYFPRLFMSNMGVFNTANLGTVKNISVNFNVGAFFDCGQGLVLDGIEEALIGDWRFANWKNEVGAVMLNVKNQLRFPKIAGCTFETAPNEAAFDVQPSIGQETFIISGNSYRGSGEIYLSGQLSGAFTAVAAADIVRTVTSVAGTPFGESIFTTSVAHDFVEGEIVAQSGFADSNYNGDFEIREIVSTTEYRIHTLFTATGAGNTGSERLDFTDVAHGLSVDAGVQITASDFALGYNTGYRVLDVPDADSFIVNGSFDTTDTGTWSTDGLTQADPRMRVIANAGIPDSQALVFGEMNGNVATTTVADGTYAAVNVTGITENPVTERFIMIDAVAGIFQYTGKEPISATLLAVLTANSVGGGTTNYRFAVSVNGAIPAFGVPHAPIQIKAENTPATVLKPVALVENDTVQIMSAGNGTAAALEVLDFVIEIRKE